MSARAVAPPGPTRALLGPRVIPHPASLFRWPASELDRFDPLPPLSIRDQGQSRERYYEHRGLKLLIVWQMVSGTRLIVNLLCTVLQVSWDCRMLLVIQNARHRVGAQGTLLFVTVKVAIKIVIEVDRSLE